MPNETEFKKIVDFIVERNKRDGWVEFKSKAMEDICKKEKRLDEFTWFVAIYYKRGGNLQSLIALEELTKEDAEKAAETFNGLIKEIK